MDKKSRDLIDKKSSQFGFPFQILARFLRKSIEVR